MSTIDNNTNVQDNNSNFYNSGSSNNDQDWQTAANKKKRPYPPKSSSSTTSTAADNTTTNNNNNNNNTQSNNSENALSTSTASASSATTTQHHHHHHHHHHRHGHRPTELCSPFSFWFYRKEKGINDYEKNLRKIGDFRTVEAFWGFYCHLLRPNQMPSPSDYHLFRQNIRPIWEDPENQLGGKWMVRTKSAFTPRLWEDLVLALVGGQFSDEVTGLVLSIRESCDTLSVWTRSSRDDRAKIIVRNVMKRVMDLPPGTKMEFKAHNASLAIPSSSSSSSSSSNESSTTSGSTTTTTSSTTSYRNVDIHIVPPLDSSSYYHRGSGSGGSGGSNRNYQSSSQSQTAAQSQSSASENSDTNSNSNNNNTSGSTNGVVVSKTGIIDPFGVVVTSSSHHKNLLEEDMGLL